MDTTSDYATVFGTKAIHPTDKVERPPTLQELLVKQAETGVADPALTQLRKAMEHKQLSNSRPASRARSSTTSSTDRSSSRTSEDHEVEAALTRSFQRHHLNVPGADAAIIAANAAGEEEKEEERDSISPLPHSFDPDQRRRSQSVSTSHELRRPGSPRQFRSRAVSHGCRPRSMSSASDANDIHPAVDELLSGFHGALSRQDAEIRVVGTPPGSYLVREKRIERLYALTVHLGDGQVQHHLIERSMRRDGSLGSHFIFNTQRLRECHTVRQVLEYVVLAESTGVTLGQPIPPSAPVSRAVSRPQSRERARDPSPGEHADHHHHHHRHHHHRRHHDHDSGDDIHRNHHHGHHHGHGHAQEQQQQYQQHRLGPNYHAERPRSPRRPIRKLSSV